MFRLLSILGVSLLTAASLADEPPSSLDDTRAESSESSGETGLRAFFDPVTGEMISEPTAAQLEALGQGPESEIQRRSAWELPHFYLPGGGEGVFLDGWADHSLTVQRADEGGFRVVCSQGDEHVPAVAETEESE